MTLNQQPYSGVQIAAPYCERKMKVRTDEEKAEIIKRMVSSYYGITTELIESPLRIRELVEARQIAMVLIKQNTRLSLKLVGLMFGGRDHSTVCHARDTVSELCDTDKAFLNKYNEIDNMIGRELSKPLVVKQKNVEYYPMVTVHFKANVPYFRCLKTEWEEMGGYNGYRKRYGIQTQEIRAVKHEVLPATAYPIKTWE